MEDATDATDLILTWVSPRLKSCSSSHIIYRSDTMLFLLFVSVVLAQNQCYYAANRRAGSAIQPCSSGSGVASCCQIGDLCLSDSACWNPQYNITYLYGCTDSTYTDGACPWKCGESFSQYPYVGLQYCSNTTRNEWSCTFPPSTDPAIAPGTPQQCVNDSIIAFAGPSSLPPILSLPTAIGGSTLYFSQVNPTSYTPVTGYTPRTTPRPTASVPSSVERLSTTSGSGTGTRASSTVSRTGSATPTSSSDSGLSTGAKAGIGAGIGGAALAIAAVVIAWMILRRRKPKTSGKEEILPTTTAYQPLNEKKPIQDGPAELSNVSKPAGPSELPDEPRAGTPAPTYTSWSHPQPGQQVYELPTDNTK